MAETAKAPLTWPSASWKVLKRIIRAWYTVEGRGSGGGVVQREVAKIANLQPSRLSMNKPFLQALGIIEPEGTSLTEGGKQLGLGLESDNERVTQQALQNIVRTNPLLRQLWDVIRGRGITDKQDFEAEVVVLTKQGSGSDYFATGVNVLEDILLDSGLVGMSDNSFRPTGSELRDETKTSLGEGPKPDMSQISGLRQVPIAVSASKIWYIQIDENPDETEIARFIEMQKLIFSLK